MVFVKMRPCSYCGFASNLNPSSGRVSPPAGRRAFTEGFRENEVRPAGTFDFRAGATSAMLRAWNQRR
jgi:hypothetical protein